MTWQIFVPGIKYPYTQRTAYEDRFEFFSCFYRGMNVIGWRCHNPSKELIRNTKHNTIFTVKIADGGGNYIVDGEYVVTAVQIIDKGYGGYPELNELRKKEGKTQSGPWLEITLVPRAFWLADQEADFSAYNIETIGDVLKTVYLKTQDEANSYRLKALKEQLLDKVNSGGLNTFLTPVQTALAQEAVTFDKSPSTKIPGFRINIRPGLEDRKIIDDFSIRGNFLDYIAEFCRRHREELYINSDSVSIGKIITLNTDPKWVYMTDNFVIKKEGIYNYFIHTLNRTGYLPGTLIRDTRSGISRVYYTSMLCWQGKWTTTMYSAPNDVGIIRNVSDKLGKPQWISEDMVADTIIDTPFGINSHKDRLSFDRPNWATYVGESTGDDVDDPNGSKTIADINIGEREDIRNMLLAESVVPRKTNKGHTYAGNSVGQQFPENKGVMGINVSHVGEIYNSIEVAQLYKTGDRPPKRNSNKDYRLTFPDGTTIYWEASSGEYSIMAKSKIKIGVSSSVDSTSVPDPYNIVIDSTSVVLEKGSRKITIDGTTVDIT